MIKKTWQMSLEEYKFFTNIESELQLVIDVGAYMSFFTNINAQVYYIEPDEKKYNELKEEVKNGKIFNFGLAKNKGEKVLYRGIGSMYWRTDPKHPKFKNLNYDPVTIKVITLDEFCEENSIGNITLLKIDAEGAEYDILYGGIKTIPKCQYIVFEHSYDTLMASGYVFEDINKLFKSLNYDVTNLDGTKIRPNDLNKLNNFLAQRRKNL